MNELGIASSVRSLDLDVSLDYLNANVGGRCRCYGSGNSGAHQECCKVAPFEVSWQRPTARHEFLLGRYSCLAISLSHLAGRVHLRLIRAISAPGAVPSVA